MQVVLVMFRNDGERRSFSVVRNMTVIGRREDCDLRIPVGDVSRKHCRIVTADDGVSIEDLGSSNGTFVNHERVQHSDLNAGDTIGVGPVQFIVQIDGVPEEDEMVAPAAMAAAATADDSDAGFENPTIQDDSGEHELALGEDSVDEEALDEEPLEEVGTEELAEEELPAEELALEEEPLEELPAEEEPLEELSEEEFPLEELPAEEVAEHGVTATAEPLELEEEPKALAETFVPKKHSLESALEVSEPDGLDELELDEESPAPAAHEDLTLPPPGHTHEAVEELHLDEEHPATDHPGEKSAEGSAWDFVIEEAETDHSTHEMHIDLDAPHHQQPHQ